MFGIVNVRMSCQRILTSTVSQSVEMTFQRVVTFSFYLIVYFNFDGHLMAHIAHESLSKSFSYIKLKFFVPVLAS